MNVRPLDSVWKYRSFIFGIVKRDFQSRYLNSLVGSGWAILNPLAMIFVYTVIFSQILQSRLPGVTNAYGYSIYLYIGLLIWGLFSEIVNQGSKTLLDHANLIKKVNFPRICLPAIVVTRALLNFIIQFVLFIGFLIISGNYTGVVLIKILPLIMIVVLLSAGLGMLLGALNVFFRDIGELNGVLLQFWFWFTPIVYPTTILPVWARHWILINPITPIIRSSQDLLLTGIGPDWVSLFPVFIIACSLNALAVVVYRLYAGEMVDEI
jgi:lipopolysaccharide transport system permease protein